MYFLNVCCVLIKGGVIFYVWSFFITEVFFFKGCKERGGVKKVGRVGRFVVGVGLAGGSGAVRGFLSLFFFF